MREMHWSYPDLMALPASYLDVLAEFIDEIHTARRRAQEGS